jgi:CRP/FNR family transcriptional regulator, anaerobic regulatory protein
MSATRHAIRGGARRGVTVQCCSSCPLPAACVDGRDGSLPGALLDSVAEQQTLEPGATLYRAGQRRRSIWVVSEGALKTCELDVFGREQVSAFYGQGDVMGLERIAIPEHRGFALALEPTRVCRIPVSRLLQRLAVAPMLWRELLRVAGEQLARAREVHRVLAQLQTGQRLAWFLLEGVGPQRAGCACSGAQTLHLPMQRQDIASYLGMTLESVSRSFSAMHRDGLIEVHGRSVRLLDPKGLAARILPQEPAAA